MNPTGINGKVKKGFTLIELLLVISLLGIAFGVTSDILISLVRNQVKTQVANNLEQQANFLALKLEKDLRNAYSVESYAESPYTGIKIVGRENGVVYEVFYLYSPTNSDKVLYRKGDGLAAKLPITDNSVPGGVEISCTSCITVTGTNPSKVVVSIRFNPAGTGSATTPANTGFVDINTTFVVRGTY